MQIFWCALEEKKQAPAELDWIVMEMHAKVTEFYTSILFSHIF